MQRDKPGKNIDLKNNEHPFSKEYVKNHYTKLKACGSNMARHIILCDPPKRIMCKL